MSKEVIWSGSGEKPSGALCVRNIKSRGGYDYWDKLCAIPRYGFIHSPDNSRVLKAECVGNWIDQHAAQEVVDEAQSEVNQLRAENKALLAERDALKALLVSSREFVAAYMNSSFFGPNARKQLEAIDAALQGEQP